MRKYIPLILIEGATVMAVELCGAKLLAPIYGGSLFVWAAILAVTLAGLALGYYYGGVLSSKKEPQKKLFNVIAFTAALIALMPFIASYPLMLMSFLNFKIAVILSASILIFLPIFFLGCTTPLLIRLNTINAETAGLISGRIYAISTLGGIASTLLCGFIFIPFVGLKVTLMSFAIVLFVTGLFSLKIFKLNSSLPMFIALLLSIRSTLGYNDQYTLYKSNGLMGEIEVIETPSINGAKRTLFVNQTIQTEMNMISKRSISKYIACIDSILMPGNKENALVLGLGGGMVSNVLVKKNYKVDAVEFDPRIIKVAKDFFYLSPAVECFDKDARIFINNNKKKYDVVVMDLFKEVEQPAYTLSLESFVNIRSCLLSQSKLIINWHGYMEGEIAYGTKILFNTLHRAGFKTVPIPGQGGADNRNIVVLCTPSENTECDSNIPINTDDQPIIELANAKANLRWRQLYLRSLRFN